VHQKFHRKNCKKKEECHHYRFSPLKRDGVKVYNASSKGKVRATSTAVKGSSILISIKKLVSKSRKVYVSLTSSGMKESSRTAAS